MARSFLSPAELRLLADLTDCEAELVRALMDEFDAHLVEDPREADGQATLFGPGQLAA